MRVVGSTSFELGQAWVQISALPRFARCVALGKRVRSLDLSLCEMGLPELRWSSWLKETVRVKNLELCQARGKSRTKRGRYHRCHHHHHCWDRCLPLHQHSHRQSCHHCRHRRHHVTGVPAIIFTFTAHPSSEGLK